MGKKKEKTIVQKHSANFETLKRAFLNDQVCLMDCIEKATGEHVAVICTAQPAPGNEIEFVPFAKFFNGNPYEMLLNPMEYDS
jgi:uncharacterized DUF497 family protein